MMLKTTTLLAILLTSTEALDCPICGALDRNFPNPDKEVLIGIGIVMCGELEQHTSKTVTEVGCHLIQQWADLTCDCTGPAVDPLSCAVFDPFVFSAMIQC